jgi:Flp pilus assembly protein CpaB
MSAGFFKKGISKKGDRERASSRDFAGRPKLMLPIVGLIAIFSIGIGGFLMLQTQQEAVANQADDLSSSALEASEKFGQVTLYALNRSLPAGEQILDSHIQEIYRPMNEIPEGAVRDRSELKGYYSRVEISAGEVLVNNLLKEKPKVSVLPVTPGNRAVTIEVDGTTGIEGMTLPGTHVDVILTHEVEENLVSKVIVQNTRVLSSMGNPTPFNDSERQLKHNSTQFATYNKASVHTVTLDVSPRDALAITTARQLGRLSLHLRAEGDTEISPDFDFTQTDLNATQDSSTDALAEQSERCSKGKVRMNGKDYQLTCDNQLIPLPDNDL